MVEQWPNGRSGAPAGLSSRLLFRLARRAPLWSSLAVLLAMAALSVQEPPFLTGIRDSLFDAYQRVRPRPQQDAPVRIIDIDEESLARIGQWPWSRSRLAELVHNLQEMQATAVVLDILLAEPDRNASGHPSSSVPGMPAAGTGASSLPDPDAELARTIADGRVVTGFALVKVASTALPAVKATISWAGRPPADGAAGGPRRRRNPADAGTGRRRQWLPQHQPRDRRRHPTAAAAGAARRPRLSVTDRRGAPRRPGWR